VLNIEEILFELAAIKMLVGKDVGASEQIMSRPQIAGSQLFSIEVSVSPITTYI
jgi:hypothetical protein